MERTKEGGGEEEGAAGKERGMDGRMERKRDKGEGGRISSNLFQA